MPVTTHTRQALHERAFGCCEVCGAPDAHDPHHRKLKSQGGLDTLANLLLTCRACHSRIHREPRQAKRMGWLCDPNANPASVPVRRWSRYNAARVLSLLRDDGTIDEEVQPWHELALWAD